MLDKEFSEIGELQDEYLSDEEEYMVKQIKIRLEDILEELTTAKATQIWPKLDAANWATCFTKLTGGPIEDSMDKHIITNLAETNAYLTKRVIELELKDMDFTPETIQPHRPDPIKKTTPTPTQTSWAQVAASAHQKTPTQPTLPTPKVLKTNHQEKMTDPRCLIIQVTPPIPATERPNGIDSTNHINNMLNQSKFPNTSGSWWWD